MTAASASVAAVDEFFASYRAAFERSDAAAVARHFGYPAHITSDDDDVALASIATEEEWIPQVQRLLGTYARLGVRSAHVVKRAVVDLSPQLHQVLLRWALHDAADEVLYEFDASYTLASVDGDVRITALAHNELPRLRACLTRQPWDG